MRKHLLVACLATALQMAPQTAMAEQDPTPDTIAVAEEAGVDAYDLQGAVNTTGLEPREYAYQAGLLARPQPLQSVQQTGGVPATGRRGNTVYARITYYTLGGSTANNERVHLGGTACSSEYPFGTRFRLPDGSVVTCNDRGRIESHPGNDVWLDVWGRPDLRSQSGVPVVVNP
jgi:hypothetical protein